MPAHFCTQCGASIKSGTAFCTACGAKVNVDSSQAAVKSPKSGPVAFLLCLFLGMFGIHRFYVGKIGTGILMLITGGAFGIWILVDLILIVNNKFEDKQGNALELTSNPSTFKKAIMTIGAAVAGFFVFSVTFIAIIFYLTSGLVDTIKDQLKALQSGEIEKAYSYTSKDFQKATSFNDFKKFIDQYPSLKNNKSSFFNEREIKDNTGTVRGTLTAKDGAKTPIQYKLIREDGAWKILGINVTQTGAGVEINHDSSSTKIFENKSNRYSIQYPTDWEYEQPEKGTVIFSGKKGTPSYFATVNIQTILTKKSGGKYTNLKEFMASFKKQIAEHASDAKILDQGEAQLPQNPKKFHGEYLIFTYTLKGQAFKQMQFVIFRDDGLAFYAWGYTSPVEQYNTDLPIAKAMYESWIIN